VIEVESIEPIRIKYIRKHLIIEVVNYKTMNRKYRSLWIDKLLLKVLEKTYLNLYRENKL
jgi:hypothetical protein